MQHAIFINYRREDAPDAVSRVYDKLTAAFGEAVVFKDVDDLRGGDDFGEFIASVIAKCSVALALIGPAWSESLAKRRGDSPDWVRLELETALKMPNVKVVPVLLNGANLPGSEQIPESLHPLLRLHAAIVRRDPDFHRDMSILITDLSRCGVVRSDDGSDAAGLWRELCQTDDINDLRHFIDTFSGTAQAFEARRRVDQLLTVKLLRDIGAYLEYTGSEDDHAGWLLAMGVDAFKYRWTNTVWDKELAGLRELGIESMEDPGDFFHPQIYVLEECVMTLEDWNDRATKFIAQFSEGAR